MICDSLFRVFPDRSCRRAICRTSLDFYRFNRETPPRKKTLANLFLSDIRAFGSIDDEFPGHAIPPNDLYLGNTDGEEIRTDIPRLPFTPDECEILDPSALTGDLTDIYVGDLDGDGIDEVFRVRQRASE
jgi:hypothetical protein